jgi:hypothetical protein
MPPHEPSANFSTPLLTITYTPAGLGYTFSPFLVLVFSVARALAVPVGIVGVGVWLHYRLRSLETSFTLTNAAAQDALAALRADLERMLRDMDAMDADIAALMARANLHMKTLDTLEGNVEHARRLLGVGVEESDSGGLEMGDDVEVFWGPEAWEGDGEAEGEAEEEYIDVKATMELVWEWLEVCEWPEECYDA